MTKSTFDETTTEDETPVYAEANHRGGAANLAVVHVDGQQAFDVTAIDAHLDANDPADVTLTLTHVDGSTTVVKVTKFDLLGEVIA